jgi:hypothetical protein
MRLQTLGSLKGRMNDQCQLYEQSCVKVLVEALGPTADRAEAAGRTANSTRSHAPPIAAPIMWQLMPAAEVRSGSVSSPALRTMRQAASTSRLRSSDWPGLVMWPSCRFWPRLSSDGTNLRYERTARAEAKRLQSSIAAWNVTAVTAPMPGTVVSVRDSPSFAVARPSRDGARPRKAFARRGSSESSAPTRLVQLAHSVLRRRQISDALRACKRLEMPL